MMGDPSKTLATPIYFSFVRAAVMPEIERRINLYVF